MAYVVTQPCQNCVATDCVDACPADAFREGPNMLYIDPDECICCNACVGECPVEAIYPEEEVPDPWSGYIELNREMSAKFPIIMERRTG